MTKAQFEEELAKHRPPEELPAVPLEVEQVVSEPLGDFRSIFQAVLEESLGLPGEAKRS